MKNEKLSNYAKNRTPEHAAKLKEAASAKTDAHKKKLSETNSKVVIMRIKKDGKIEEVKYPSLTKAADALGFKIALLSHYLLGRICWPEGLWGAYEKDLEIQEFLIEA